MRKRNWNRLEQSKFLKELGMLLSKGYSVSNALVLLEVHYRSYSQYPVTDIIKDLKRGTPLFEVLEGKKVPSDILGYLYFASEQGKLSFGLLEGSRILQKREHLKKMFFRTIRYPLTLLAILSGMMFFLIRFLIPQFTSLFNSVNLKLPSITVALITVLQVIPYLCYFILVVIFLLAILYPFTHRKKSPHEQLLLALRIPMLSNYIRILVTQFFAFQFGHLLRGGLSVSQAIQLFENQHYVRLFQDEALFLKNELRGGKQLDEIFRCKTYFLPELAQVVAFGQSNGSLGNELTLFSEMLFSNLEERLHRNLNLIQPILFGVIGCLVLILFLTVMAPIFHLFQSL
ncbi:competence type IV pilus assembly protein ComGB [Alkalihalobacillus sp. AL-G]|uniref:competence type IV pilus assembly protein ComGB n=1 Tax=Alkalihalobacillus sp. AL-G TaxID=2926399 RepID=UPI00272D2C64|nr:competence type IV pilus assembly protein ComGB [Alkalihalobacillus sp. AL-G]WLD92052.1 type II secretion system F family protein [Alkalihalobacillus sp. AL-G]